MDMSPESCYVFSEVCSFYSQIFKNFMFIEQQQNNNPCSNVTNPLGGAFNLAVKIVKS